MQLWQSTAAWPPRCVALPSPAWCAMRLAPPAPCGLATCLRCNTVRVAATSALNPQTLHHFFWLAWALQDYSLPTTTTAVEQHSSGGASSRALRRWRSMLVGWLAFTITGLVAFAPFFRVHMIYATAEAAAVMFMLAVGISLSKGCAGDSEWLGGRGGGVRPHERPQNGT